MPSIWVNVSTLAKWRRPPVGVVRVEQAYCRWLLSRPEVSADGQVPVRFCVYDRGCADTLTHWIERWTVPHGSPRECARGGSRV
jgi:hypothetical protein